MAGEDVAEPGDVQLAGRPSEDLEVDHDRLARRSRDHQRSRPVAEHGERVDPGGRREDRRHRDEGHAEPAGAVLGDVESDAAADPGDPVHGRGPLEEGVELGLLERRGDHDLLRRRGERSQDLVEQRLRDDEETAPHVHQRRREDPAADAKLAEPAHSPSPRSTLSVQGPPSPRKRLQTSKNAEDSSTLIRANRFTQLSEPSVPLIETPRL
jgi:hypothetical protein